MQRRTLLATLFLIAIPAFAKEKPVYQDGVFKSFSTSSDGSTCNSSGTINGRVNADSDSTGTVNATTSSSTNCYARHTANYTVIVGQQTFVLYPAPSVAKVGGIMLTMGIASAFYKNSVLYGQLPGIPIKIRSNGSGDFYVKVGKRESEYKLAAAY